MVPEAGAVCAFLVYRKFVERNVKHVFMRSFLFTHYGTRIRSQNSSDAVERLERCRGMAQKWRNSLAATEDAEATIASFLQCLA